MSLPRSEPVGFYEETDYGPGSQWSDGAAEALQSSHAMVCLLSLPYFHSELGGKEWDVFAQRRPAPVILAVNWITSPGPRPMVISDLLGRPDSIHQTQPLTQMLKSGNLREYAEFVKTLANKIIHAASEIDPLPLEPFPSMREAENAFYLWDDDREKVDTAPIREHVVEDTARASSKPHNQSSLPSQSKYSTFVISKSNDFLDMIEDSCDDSSFVVTRHPDPDHAMRRVRRLISDDREREVPELFVIDLDGGKDEFRTVKELSEELDVPSGILAVASKFDRSIWDQLKGATPLVGAFVPNELIDQMKVCAAIGRNIRIHRDEKRQDPDPSRSREVFLSYRSLDKGLATVLRRGLEARRIGVSYMDDDDATRWKDKIETWISEARIFLALVTENYLTSKYCVDELSRFAHILEHPELHANVGKRKLNLILNLYNKPDTHKHDLIEKCREEYDVFPMSDADFAVRLSRLVTRIQNLLTKPAA